MDRFLSLVQDILQSHPWLVVEPSALPSALPPALEDRFKRRIPRVLGRQQATLLMLGLFGMTYGAVMGGYSANALQMLYSALKVPLLLLATFSLSVPFFFVLCNLLGLRDDFAVAIRAQLAAQAGLAIVLASLAPITGFIYVAGLGYDAAIMMNAVAFAIASFAGQLIVARHYRPLIQRQPRYALMLRLWLLIYSFVGIQMGWVLRPFIGKPGDPVVFFRGTELNNAYVEIIRKMIGALGLG